STFIDLLMGLLEPTEGKIFLDNKDLYSNLQNSIYSWRSNISHVPQAIYLSDLSLAENIAFGIPKEKIESKKLKAVCKMAQIDSFIDSLPKGYSTYVGENGVRLSGGQRQRIGIARALYKDKEVLILDEATSALDEKTEEAVMDSIYKIYKDITIIMIAHRKSTLTRCDRIIEFSDGKISEISSKSI
ncbi:ATP-binding cassette domain-containing protein, partial [Prochlorococcus sp. AH-716-F13]|nr:ATP-binding cassette domain-containing protein [Prochlorococcus sp. AH-716-F13]